jgi:hypothetical protein
VSNTGVKPRVQDFIKSAKLRESIELVFLNIIYFTKKKPKQEVNRKPIFPYENNMAFEEKF